MIRINQIKLNPNHSENDLLNVIKKNLRLKNEKFTYTIEKCSLDSREKPYVKFIYAVNVCIDNFSKSKEIEYISKLKNKDISSIDENKYSFKEVICQNSFLDSKYIDEVLNSNINNNRPVVVGFGPCGIFSALLLAKHGFKPLVLERGCDVDERTLKVSQFWQGMELDEECNVQFGEGGAGTFSDGKLNTQVKEKYGRIRYVLETLVEYGAPKEIIYSNKPHIGTDILSIVVKNMRNAIISMGGEVRFNSKLTDLKIIDNKLTGIVINNNEELECNNLILAIGHSARDTFRMLQKKNIDMSAKSIAIGVRIEHPQSMIDEYAYDENIYELPAASYKVTHKAEGERGVYSFCMCPGGYVVNASSQKEKLCINGMSYSGRDSANANSAIVVTVTPDDYGNDDALAGVKFIEELEAKAYKACDGKIPSQVFGDFKSNVDSKSFGDFLPCTKGEYKLSNLHNILPQYICDTIIEGVDSFARQIPGFNRNDAILHAIESRTSSPVRINRNDDTLMSNIEGIIPCGEGAGYAGGITSAAVDGMKAAESYVRFLCR